MTPSEGLASVIFGVTLQKSVGFCHARDLPHPRSSLCLFNPTQVRKFRTLTELIMDAEEHVKNPYKGKKLKVSGRNLA